MPDVGSFLEPAFAFASLRGKVTDAGTESMELLIYYNDATGWKFFSSALDSDGNSLIVSEPDRQIAGISVIEQFSASLTRPYLESHKESGLNIRFGGKYGLLVVKLPESYINAFLNRLEKVEASVRTKLAKSDSQPAVALSEKPKLGVGYLPVNAEFAKIAGMETPRGVFLAKIANNSVAAKAGLKVGDAVLAIDGTPVSETATGLQDAIASVKSGSRISMTLWRNGQEVIVPVQF